MALSCFDCHRSDGERCIAPPIPGVIIGGQLGPRITGRVPERTLIRSLGWLFVAVAAVTLIEAVVG